jgi:hypothetical protein
VRCILGSTAFVYYESRKREIKTRPIYECQCDERLKTKSQKSTRLTYTGLVGDALVVQFIMNQERESYRQGLCMSVGVMKD